MLREGVKETEVIVMKQYWVLHVSVTGVKQFLVEQRANVFMGASLYSQSSKVCSLNSIAPGPPILSWAQVTVCMEFFMFSSCLLGFHPGSSGFQPHKNVSGGYLDKNKLCVNLCASLVSKDELVSHPGCFPRVPRDKLQIYSRKNTLHTYTRNYV